MSAGRRDTLVSFETSEAVVVSGEETLTWAEHAQEWVAVFYGRGDERRQAAVEQGSQPATFQALANLRTLAVGVKDRIVGAGGIWNIQGIAPDTPKRGLIEFTAVRGL